MGDDSVLHPCKFLLSIPSKTRHDLEDIDGESFSGLTREKIEPMQGTSSYFSSIQVYNGQYMLTDFILNSYDVSYDRLKRQYEPWVFGASPTPTCANIGGAVCSCLDLDS